jgi:hypothetical protein
MAYFLTKNPNLVYFVGLLMENLGIFHGHFGTLHKSIWCILPPFGVVCVNLVYFVVIRYFLC